MSHRLVSFVGAGPGDPELITLKGLRRLREAEVVLHDRLVPHELLDEVSPGATVVDVGKTPGRPCVGQGQINWLLVDWARRREHVVRLKGGDPAVFGRLDEETEALRAAGIEFDIVPGISAVFAAAAELRTSLTLRGVARAVTLVTPSVGEGEGAADAWAEAVRAQAGGATLAVYMAGRAIESTARRLLALGLAPSTPFIVIESVSLPEQRSWLATLDVAARGGCAIGDGPVLLLVGDALAHATAASEAPTIALAA
jgi:uroporphyrin-III C-methyltransferase